MVCGKILLLLELERGAAGVRGRSGGVGAFEGYLASLPPVIGLGFGGYGEWSAEVGALIGQAAEIGWVSAMGRRRRADGTRTGLRRACGQGAVM